eukprot:Nitzschia sp. Nitz4//scaffold153_size53422//41610//43282//NITZ4_006765-RA/size53422-augustus-gene-0.44-mRNA-1//1//CDS//3329537274//5544//frame0
MMENSNSNVSEAMHTPDDFARRRYSNRQRGAHPLSFKLIGELSGLFCRDCGYDPISTIVTADAKDKDTPSELYNLQAFERPSSSISPLVAAPMLAGASASPSANQIESILAEYMCLCQFYKVPYNAGVVTTLRFSLPSLRVSGSFHDMDMMALVELLLRHANDKLRFVRRLDFGIASKEGRRFRSYKLGFTSHGAFALAKVLQTTKYIQQVWLPRHRIGPYGASALFIACRENPSIQMLNLRRCRIQERGAFAFIELIGGAAKDGATNCGLVDVDLSANGIGNRGTMAVELAVKQRNEKLSTSLPLFVNIEGNLVFPEIMNGVTHGLGIILSIVAWYLLSERVKGESTRRVVSCMVYSASLFVLYTLSTLFHSFFALQHIRYVFQVMDKCAIYILIAGSYTPFLTVMFADEPLISVGLLGFIWTCGFLGISVEAFFPSWKWKSIFSLSMYLGLGWAALVCIPKIEGRVPPRCAHLLVFGGVGYTAGVPFFVRNNNLDHAIWHLFVLLGSIFHWLGVYLYVAPYHADCPSLQY